MDEHATYTQAVEIWKTEGKVSVCMLQRRLGIGYGRAQKLYEQLILNRFSDTPPAEPRRGPACSENGILGFTNEEIETMQPE